MTILLLLFLERGPDIFSAAGRFGRCASTSLSSVFPGLRLCALFSYGVRFKKKGGWVVRLFRWPIDWRMFEMVASMFIALRVDVYCYYLSRPVLVVLFLMAGFVDLIYRLIDWNSRHCFLVCSFFYC